jgi:hypothetical protein
MSSENIAIATFKTHHDAEEAVKKLQHDGFDMKKLSIVGHNYHTEEHVLGYYNNEDRIKTWGKLGAFSGAIMGALFGSGLFLVPGVGPVLIAGPLLASLVAALEGGVLVGSMGVISASLVGLGIPKDSALKYETEIKADTFLLLVQGKPQDVHRAQKLIEISEVFGAALV